jgi:hypothetical protein
MASCSRVSPRFVLTTPHFSARFHTEVLISCLFRVECTENPIKVHKNSAVYEIVAMVASLRKKEFVTSATDALKSLKGLYGNEDGKMQEFFRRCLDKKPEARPNAVSFMNVRGGPCYFSRSLSLLHVVPLLPDSTLQVMLWANISHGNR